VGEEWELKSFSGESRDRLGSSVAIRGPELLLHSRFVSLTEVCGLDVLLHTDKALLQGVERRRVEHLLLDLGSVRTPGHQEQLLLLGGLARPLALVRVLEVEDSVSALPRAPRLQVGHEVDVGSSAVANLLHVDLGVIADVEHDVAVLLLLLNLLEAGLANISHRHTGRHLQAEVRSWRLRRRRSF